MLLLQKGLALLQLRLLRPVSKRVTTSEACPGDAMFLSGSRGHVFLLPTACAEQLVA